MKLTLALGAALFLGQTPETPRAQLLPPSGGSTVILAPVAQDVQKKEATPAPVAAAPAQACGAGGCGSGGCGAGGCGSCGSAKPEEVKAYFADLRRQMEVTHRVPLA